MHLQFTGDICNENIKPWLQIDFVHRWMYPESFKAACECNKLLEQFVEQIVQRKHKEWQLRTRVCDDAATVGFGNDATDVDAVAADNNTKQTETEQHTTWQRRIFIEQIFKLVTTGELTLRDISECKNGNASVTSRNWSKENVLSKNGQGKNHKNNNNSDNNNGNANAKCHDSKKHVIVPGNSIIVLDTFNMQRDVTWWGPNAQPFEPQRFLQQQQQQHGKRQQEDGQEPERRHSYSFLPFSKGLRTCIGRRYSFFMMKVFLVKLIGTFEFHTKQKLQQLRYVEGISLKFRSADEIYFQIHKIKQQQRDQQHKCEAPAARTDFRRSMII